MNDHNLDDLIIGEPRGKGGKSKSVLTLLALILIIFIVGTVLVKLITEDETQLQPQESAEISSLVHPEMHPSKEEIPEELKPIVEEKLPPLPKKNTAPKATVNTKHESAKKPAARIDELSPKPKIQVSPKKMKEKVSKEKSRPKPSELFKKTSSTRRIYYIQVGSFKRPPSQKFLDKIKASGYTPLIVKSGEMIKVRVGPYSSYNSAKAKLPEVKSKIGIDGFVVRKK